ESHCILFAISPEKIHYRSFDLDASLIQNIKRFIDLNGNISYVQDEKKFRKSKGQYQQLGHNLYKLLLQSSLHEFSNVQSLLIIPDGLLAYLPFEVLLEKEASQPYSYKSFPYLLRKYAITYEYSASTLCEAIESNRSAEYSYAGFAPEYRGDDSFLPAGIQKVRKSMPNISLTKLRFNQEEVQQVAKLMQGTSVLGGAATEYRFKRDADRYDILHLAMHAFLDDDEALKSGLVFSHEEDSLEDGVLHAYELYKMDLKAQLVVLSACHTAGGKLARGEGILSLTRAFKFAGCPNIISSFWQADDKSTQVLMEDFFQQLKTSSSAAESIQAVKLSYLKQASEVQAHPSNWAAWTLIGDPEALSSKRTQTSRILLFFILLLISGFFIWLYRA
ncbi:MAG: CHAT domain-containing protein, partial [Bacteroidota bacterium]